MKKMAMELAASMPPITAMPMTCRDTRRRRSPCQRHAAENEGEGGHQNGPQAELGAFERGINQRLALLVAHLGKLDDENGVFGRQADEHDQTDLGIDVVFEVTDHQAGKRAEHGDGHAQQHAERQTPAFVLRRQNQEHAKERETKDDHRRNALRALFSWKLMPR